MPDRSSSDTREAFVASLRAAKNFVGLSLTRLRTQSAVVFGAIGDSSLPPSFAISSRLRNSLKFFERWTYRTTNVPAVFAVQQSNPVRRMRVLTGMKKV